MITIIEEPIVKEYVVVHSTSLQEFASKIESMCHAGYKLQGGLYVHMSNGVTFYFQAMVFYK